MRLHPIVFLLFLVAPAVQLTAAEASSATFVARRLEAKPKMDGMVKQDPAWAKAAVNAEPFYVLGRVEKAPLQTRFQVGYTAEGIYLAVVCDEPHVDKIVSELGDMEAIYGEDSVEIYLSPTATDRKLQLVFNAIGSRFNTAYEGQSDQVLQWDVKTYLGDKFWSAEVFIPFSTIEQVPDKGAVWRLCVARSIHTLPDAPVFTAWTQCPGAGEYQDLANRRPLVFADALSAEEIQAATEGIKKAAAEKKTTGESVVVAVRPNVGLCLWQAGRGDWATLERLRGAYVAPRLMPDRKHVLYQSKLGGTLGIWRLAIKDKSSERICDGEEVAVSPDGGRIVFVRNGAVMERNLATGQERMVSPEGWTTCAFPTYLSDGKICFVQKGDPDGVHIVGENRERTAPLIQGDIGSAPRGSPDGKWIAYQNGAHIWLYDVATRERRQLTSFGGIQRWPLWSADSKTLCFCATYDPFSDDHDLYRIEMDRPQSPVKVIGNIESSPDWSGVLPKAPTAPAGAENLRVLISATAIPLPLTEDLFADKDFKSIPLSLGLGESSAENVKDAFKLESGADVVLDNNQAALLISSRRNTLMFLVKGDGKQLVALELVSVDGKGQKATGVKGLAWQELSADSAAVRVAFETAGGGSCAMVFALARTRPTLTIRPEENGGEVWVRGAWTGAVVTDRYANDLLVEPGQCSDSAVILPYAPQILAFPEKTHYFLMMTLPDAAQAVRLVKDQAGGMFSAVQVQMGNRPVDLSALAGTDIWSRPTFERVAATSLERRLRNPLQGIAVSTNAANWSAAWTPPFDAQWRVAMRGKKEAYAAMVPMSAYVSETKRINLTMDSEVFKSDSPECALIYPLGRTPRTPLTRLVPADMLFDTVGLKAGESLLDLRGIRDCPLGRRYPFKDYRVVLKVISWVESDEQEGARKTLQNFADDLLKMVEGMDQRIREYRALFDKLDVILKEGEPGTPALQECIGALKASIQAGKKIPEPNRTSSDAFKASEESFKKSFDKADFNAVCANAFPERVDILAQFRRLSKEIRDRAGLSIVQFPGQEPVFEKLREEIRLVLRNRSFQEGDWRGEEQICPEEVDYETICNIW